jgi:hypothetical protein
MPQRSSITSCVAASDDHVGDANDTVISAADPAAHEQQQQVPRTRNGATTTIRNTAAATTTRSTDHSPSWSNIVIVNHHDAIRTSRQAT